MVTSNDSFRSLAKVRCRTAAATTSVHLRGYGSPCRGGGIFLFGIRVAGIGALVGAHQQAGREYKHGTELQGTRRAAPGSSIRRNCWRRGRQNRIRANAALRDGPVTVLAAHRVVAGQRAALRRSTHCRREASQTGPLAPGARVGAQDRIEPGSVRYRRFAGGRGRTTVTPLKSSPMIQPGLPPGWKT